MHKNILETIRSAYYQLTAAERRVADLALEQHSRVQYMSISELAEASGVSEATITRFCKRVGAGGVQPVQDGTGGLCGTGAGGCCAR